MLEVLHNEFTVNKSLSKSYTPLNINAAILFSIKQTPKSRDAVHGGFFGLSILGSTNPVLGKKKGTA